jgi:signal transduction histidine kinase
VDSGAPERGCYARGWMARQRDRKDMLLEAGMALSSELSLSAVLQRIVELAVQVTEARYGAVGVLDSAGGIAEFVTTGISEEQRRAIGRLPVGKGILGALITDGTPLRLPEISLDPRSVGFPPNHPPMHSFLGAPVKAKGKMFGNIYLTEKQGAEEFSDEDEETLVILAAQAGVAVENARLYEESRQREQRLEAVRENLTAILAGMQPERVLELLAGSAKELVAADLATIVLPAEQSGSLVIQVADGFHADELQGTEFPLDRSVSGEVIRTGAPILDDDASADERTSEPIVRSGEMGPAMFVPLTVQGSAFGTLTVSNRRGGRQFGDDDLTLVQTFGAQASVAIEYGRAQRELHRLAVLEGRERIAKELHDGVIQSLFAVGMGLQATATLSRDPDIEQRIEGAVGEMDRVIRDLRNYIFGLRPGILADRQLDEALHRLAAEFQERTGVTTVVEVDPQVAAGLSSVAGDVVQLVREALSNVGRHAHAVTCRVSLRRRDGRALLEIDDDGTGFDPAAAAGRGQGLGNLKDRAGSLGGDVEIESEPDEGTIVRALLPL